MLPVRLCVSFISIFCAAPAALAQKTNEASSEKFVGHVIEPRKAKLDNPTSLTAPHGFKVTVFAKDLVNPRMLAIGPEGRVYVTRRSVGDVVMLYDRDEDGLSDETLVVANAPGMHGIAIDGNEVFLVTVKDVFRGEIAKDGAFTDLKKIIDDLPDGGQHPNRTIGVGPDNQLYISVGSTCNECAETTQEAATLLVASKDGSKRRIFSAGLRNTIGFDWHPITSDLWGMDHNVDWFGDDNPPEELNKLELGKKYGWPYILGPTFLNPQDDPPGDITLEQWRDSSAAPTLTYTAHAAPMQMAFHSGAGMPAGYAGDAFVAMRGSWNRNPPSGYEIVRIRYTEGKASKIEPWITGFLKTEGDVHTRTARPAGLAVAADGAILFTDDENGVVYRVAYAGRDAARPAQPASPPAPKSSSSASRLATDELPSDGKLVVNSSAFDAGSRIPLRHSDYGDQISPALTWSKGPAATKSYVIFMDDPDAKPELVNHWTVYNISPDVMELPEGFPTEPSLNAPVAAQQGANTLNRTGYFGPRPPAGDPDHKYHFQVFALDAMLDLPPGVDRSTLLKAMQGHVLASGVIIGKFSRNSDVQSAADKARNVRRE